MAWSGDALVLLDEETVEIVRRKQFSPSTAKVFSKKGECTAVWAAGKLLPQTGESPFGPSAMGHSFHEAMEDFYNLPVHQRSRDFLSAWLLISAKHTFPDPPPGPSRDDEAIEAIQKNRQQWIDRLQRFMDNLFSLEHPHHVQVWGTEFEMTPVVTEDGVPARGSADRIEVDPLTGRLRIIDYKSSKNKPDLAWGDEHGDQLRIYSYLLRVVLGLDYFPEAALLYVNFAGAEVRVVVDTTEDRIRATMDVYRGAWVRHNEQMDSGVLVTRGSGLCAWCPLVNACPVAARGKIEDAFGKEPRPGKSAKLVQSPSAEALNIPSIAPGLQDRRQIPPQMLASLRSQGQTVTPSGHSGGEGDDCPSDIPIVDSATTEEGVTSMSIRDTNLPVLLESGEWNEERDVHNEIFPNSRSLRISMRVTTRAHEIARESGLIAPSVETVSLVAASIHALVGRAQREYTGLSKADMMRPSYERLFWLANQAMRSYRMPLPSFDGLGNMLTEPGSSEDWSRWANQMMSAIHGMLDVSLRVVDRGVDPTSRPWAALSSDAPEGVVGWAEDGQVAVGMSEAPEREAAEDAPQVDVSAAKPARVSARRRSGKASVAAQGEVSEVPAQDRPAEAVQEAAPVKKAPRTSSRRRKPTEQAPEPQGEPSDAASDWVVPTNTGWGDLPDPEGRPTW